MAIEKRAFGRTALQLSTLGFGGGPIGWRQAETVTRDAAELIDTAWAAGIRYFDTAPFYGYGDSERRLGRELALRSRDDFVLSTKVGRLIRPRFAGDRDAAQVVYDYSREGARRSIEESLARLGVGRIDIALIHDIDRWTHGEAQPLRFREALDGAYRALADLKAEGVIGAIGLGVNEWQVCEAFAREVPIDGFLLAGQVSLLRHEARQSFLPFCAERGIGLIIGGPLNSGILATGAVAGAQFDYAPASEAILARTRRIEAVCGRFGVPLAAAALAFILRQPAVASVIPGFATASELKAILALREKPVPEAFWQALEAEGLLEQVAA